MTPGIQKSRSHGSSPQARGTLYSRFLFLFKERFIPAGAGNTQTASARGSRCPVHPRRRGEHLHGLHRNFSMTGSSPQARGTLRPIPQSMIRCRFIPAGAGNTSRPGCIAWPSAVHPRRRGEHIIVPPHDQQEPGSSPQARGTPVRQPILYPDRRFIPAGAGNTPRVSG